MIKLQLKPEVSKALAEVCDKIRDSIGTVKRTEVSYDVTDVQRMGGPLGEALLGASITIRIDIPNAVVVGE
jgi:hypothetical protein